MFITLINLEDSRARRDDMVAQLQREGASFQVLPAVDGRSRKAGSFPMYADSACRRRHGRSLNGGEVACYLSHIEALKAFVASDESVALILEDDVALPEEMMDKLNQIVAFIQSNKVRWDVLNLVQPDLSYAKELGNVAGFTLYRSYYLPMRTAANLWSKEGAMRFLESGFARQVRGPYDTELRSYCTRSRGGLCIDRTLFDRRAVKSDINASLTPRSPSVRWRPIIPRITRHLPDRFNARLGMLFGSD